MKSDTPTPETNVEFIRLFFPEPEEERMALRLAGRLASELGEQVAQLRPDTTLAEIFNWAEVRSRDSIEFVLSLEQELGLELDEFLDDLDDTTFRELVQRAARAKPDFASLRRRLQRGTASINP